MIRNKKARDYKRACAAGKVTLIGLDGEEYLAPARSHVVVVPAREWSYARTQKPSRRQRITGRKP